MRKRSPSDPARTLPSDLPATTEALHTLVEVVRHGSLTAAARELGTTTSAVSKRLSRFEDTLGVRLVERTTRKLALTEAGEALHERALAILDDLAEAEEEVSRHADTPRGTLRISAPVIFGERVLMPHVASFIARHPLVRAEISFSDRFVDLVSGRFDCALRITRNTDSSLVAKKLGRMPVLVVGAPSYLARYGTPRTPEGLARHQCLRYSLLATTSDWRFRKGRKELGVQVGGRIEVDHGGAMLEAVRAGLGLARLPMYIVHEGLEKGELREVLAPYRLPPIDVVLVHSARKHVPRKVRAFAEHLATEMTPHLVY